MVVVKVRNIVVGAIFEVPTTVFAIFIGVCKFSEAAIFIVL